MSHDVVHDSLALAQLAELSHRLLSLTETTERLASGITNHVLYAGTIRITADGWASFSWQATCGAVEVTNPGANVVKVVASGPGNDSNEGTGTHFVRPGTFRILNINARTFTIYGTVNDLVGVQAFTTGGVAGQGRAA
jgi:hypothetical protein